MRSASSGEMYGMSGDETDGSEELRRYAAILESLIESSAVRRPVSVVAMEALLRVRERVDELERRQREKSFPEPPGS